MRQTYESFTVVGTPLPVFSDQFARLAKDEKRCRFCLSFSQDTQGIARDSLTLRKQTSSDLFQLHEFSSAPSESWLIAHDATGNGIEAIICFPPTNENSADGLYLTGSAAKAFVGCIAPFLISRSLEAKRSVPFASIRICR